MILIWKADRLASILLDRGKERTRKEGDGKSKGGRRYLEVADRKSLVAF